MSKLARLGALGAATIAIFSLAACAQKSNGGGNPTGSGTAGGSSCSPSSLKTHAAGKLTVATDSPAYEPWFVDNKPSNGKGFESAVAYAVAKQLGYSATDVVWTHASFTSVIAPTPKQYDLDINEVSITDQRKKAVDFSTGYYDVAQAIITLKGSKIAGVTTISGLKSAKLGAQQGTTSFDAINDVIKPSAKAHEYPTNDLAVQALKNKQIDGLVVDLPTGLYLTSAELDNAQIVGQLPVTGTPEQFGLVLSKGSSLTACVSQAVTALRTDGTLKQLQEQWLTTSAGAPELKP